MMIVLATESVTVLTIGWLHNILSDELQFCFKLLKPFLLLLCNDLNSVINLYFDFLLQSVGESPSTPRRPPVQGNKLSLFIPARAQEIQANDVDANASASKLAKDEANRAKLPPLQQLR